MYHDVCHTTRRPTRVITRSTTLRLPRNNSSQEPWKRCAVLFLLGGGGGGGGERQINMISRHACGKWKMRWLRNQLARKPCTDSNFQLQRKQLVLLFSKVNQLTAENESPLAKETSSSSLLLAGVAGAELPAENQDTKFFSEKLLKMKSQDAARKEKKQKGRRPTITLNGNRVCFYPLTTYQHCCLQLSHSARKKRNATELTSTRNKLEKKLAAWIWKLFHSCTSSCQYPSQACNTTASYTKRWNSCPQ